MSTPENELHGWTHPMCVACWRRTHGEFRPPHTIAIPLRERESCCWCGHDTDAGIYVREDPRILLNCRGSHP